MALLLVTGCTYKQESAIPKFNVFPRHVTYVTLKPKVYLSKN